MRRTLALCSLFIIFSTMFSLALYSLDIPMVGMTETAYADSVDIADDITDGITSVTNTLKKIVNPIAITSLVLMGIYLAVNSDAQSLKKVKIWLISILIGLLLVNLSDRIVIWASEIGV